MYIHIRMCADVCMCPAGVLCEIQEHMCVIGASCVFVAIQDACVRLECVLCVIRVHLRVIRVCCVFVYA